MHSNIYTGSDLILVRDGPDIRFFTFAIRSNIGHSVGYQIFYRPTGYPGHPYSYLCDMMSFCLCKHKHLIENDSLKTYSRLNPDIIVHY